MKKYGIIGMMMLFVIGIVNAAVPTQNYFTDSGDSYLSSNLGIGTDSVYGNLQVGDVGTQGQVGIGGNVGNYVFFINDTTNDGVKLFRYEGYDANVQVLRTDGASSFQVGRLNTQADNQAIGQFIGTGLNDAGSEYSYAYVNFYQFDTNESAPDGKLTLSVRDDGSVVDELTITPGTVDITGALSKGSGTLKTDNPENPLNEWIYHQFYESPEALLIYRGQGSTEEDQFFNNSHGWYYWANPTEDANTVKIHLPSWFNDMTFRNDNYQEFTGTITGIKSFCGDAYFNFDYVEWNDIYVTTEKPCQFSWDIKTARHDPYYEVNPMDVIVQKDASDIGKIRHEDAYDILGILPEGYEINRNSAT